MFGPLLPKLALGATVASLVSGFSSPAPADPPRCTPGAAENVTIAATTDVHGRVRGWDYYADKAETNRGLTRAATIIDSIRAANPDRVVVVDAGDLLQGNPFAYVAARVLSDRRNPIVAAMNALRYDAAVIGNHEFNYGVPYLDSAVQQATVPFLAANVSRHGAPAYKSMVVVRRGGARIAIIGATTPGSNVWDQANLAQAGMHIEDIEPRVAREVAAARPNADVVIVVLHSGLDEPSSYDTVTTKLPSENVALRVAREVPGIDVVVYGHSHKENGGITTGHTLLVQPKNWATSVAVATVSLSCSASGSWSVGSSRGTLVQATGHVEAKSVLDASRAAHEATVRYVTSPIGSTPDAWRADSARVQDTPLIDFILEVERRAAHADLASSAAFDTRSHLGPGPITIAQMAQLYPYENTLRAVRISGAQLRAYIEFSSRYYKTSPSRDFVVDTTVAGYNFDVVSGAEYAIDLSMPMGSRVTTLTYHGKPVAPTDSFTLALNNYRQTGGGGYAMLAGAPVVYDKQQEIRQLLIDEVRRRGTLRMSDYFVPHWSFVRPGRQ